MGGSGYYQCYTCRKDFPAGCNARNNHLYSTGHEAPDFECDRCPRWFRTRAACEQHMRDTGHYDDCNDDYNDGYNYDDNEFECLICFDIYPSKEERTDHEIYDHYFCADCDRSFDNYNNIKMHLNSRAHRGTQITCPFCEREYTAATGVVHHLESGRCTSARGLNRDQIYRIVKAKDPQGVLAKHLIGWSGSSQYEANQRSWNGHGYECYLCHSAFTQLAGLNQHLNSPRHQQALYHCPNRGCGIDFKSLAAVVNHLESESCGFIRFEQVQKKIGNIVSGDRRIAF